VAWNISATNSGPASFHIASTESKPPIQIASPLRSSLTQFRKDARISARIVRLSRGDLPDWVTSTADLTKLTVAEAKGCHDRSGPAKALERAWAQANRIDLVVNGKRATVKRIAIATRWGTANAGPQESHLSAKDPEDAGDPITPQELNAIYIGVLRQHIANMIDPLGYHELAALTRQLTTNRFPNTVERTLSRARQVLDRASVKEVIGGDQVDGLLGGIVTRAGPLADTAIAPTDQEMLATLNLRPMFVGIERDLVISAVEGDVETVRKRLKETARRDEIARSDQAGGWIVPLGHDQRFVKDQDQ